MSHTLDLLSKLLKMGCICTKESVVIEGRSYVVLERIGEGGFSNIDLVENRRTKQYFALKRITCHSTEDQIAANREIEYHKHLDHPNILRLEGSSTLGQADIVHNQTSEVLLLLPYFQRGTLHDELVKREAIKDPMDEKLILNIFSAVCEGVLHMHNAKPNPLAHRDIKPHNILLSKDYTPVIMDLGSMTLARVKINSHSEAQYLQDLAAERCSMPYRPPELFQVNSKCDIDERTDVWSLGCLLYAMCFYKSPFDSVYERGDSVALAVQSATIEFPKNHNYSEELTVLIKWMLTAEIDLRPQLPQIMDKLKQLVINAQDQL